MKNKCAVCGEEYEVCISCGSVKTYKPWRTVTDSINCYKIFSAVSSYTNGYSSAAELKKELELCDLSHLSLFNENIKNIISNL